MANEGSVRHLSVVPNRDLKRKELRGWLRAQMREMNVTTKDPAYRFMLEKLAEHKPELDKAQTDSEFEVAIREHAAIGRKALRLGVEAEDTVSRKKDEITSAGCVFRMLRERKA